VETTDTRLGWRSTKSALRALLGQSLVLFAAAWSFDYWQAWLCFFRADTRAFRACQR